jgi:DNA (cytosine-5)-methyltransferase 1
MADQQSSCGGLRELALFAGAGGGILGGHLLGWRTVCAVEWDTYAASVLVARQNDGCLAPFPVWDDVQSFDGRPWRGRVDVVSGGFPCQDISAAGRGAGIDGAKSGLWRHMARVVGEVRPRYVLVENSPMLVHRGLPRVLGDLASMGYDARWCVLGAHDVGAPHKRDRLWIVATDAHGQRGWPEQERQRGGEGAAVAGDDGAQGDVADADGPQREGNGGTVGGEQEHADASVGGWWASERGLDRVAHGVAHRMDRLRAIGNGQCPPVVALAWRTLIG